MTATALDGRDLPHSDSFGNPFDIADHRRLYRFRYGTRFGYEQRDDTRWEFTSEEPDDFSAACTDVLALAARASAGFPANCVMGGGVLNSAPFEPVQEAITGRGGWWTVPSGAYASTDQRGTRRAVADPGRNGG
ncbi:hypothetical protein [Streptomyces chryseus]|uniref:Uncharacterized protein n=1 Tax=Streptomyces chryseus TaxID=68186 RepID=A0ABQ3DHK8_9ACTN|nr:hypothetical protein [Streptomyces chryseus]GHA96251.1 hypothetical protein GCM10010346_18750 [Streptomyces chryseus]